MTQSNDRVKEHFDWVGSSKKDLKCLPRKVVRVFGKALLDAQYGELPGGATPLVGFGGASVLEIRSDSPGGTFRVVYTVKFARAIYVLHAFQKKSTSGIKTSPADIRLVHERLRIAEELYEKWCEDNPASAGES